LLYREAIGHDGFNSTHVIIDDTTVPVTRYTELDTAFGSPPAIFVRYSDNPASNNFMEDFRWVRGIVPNLSNPDDYSNLDVASIEEFLAARKVVVPDLDWPAFKERLDEMNNKNPNGSRTGDIVTIMDGRNGYLTVNYAEESFSGWHGGPTVSESNVPLIFAMPGESFVDGSGNTVSTHPKLISGFNGGVANAGLKADGHLRNWHLTPILREIVTQFRDD